MCAKKFTDLSDGKPNKNSLQLVDCDTCSGSGKIGDKKCPVCSGVGQMTRSKRKRMK